MGTAEMAIELTALSAAVGHVRKTWGDHGYRIVGVEACFYPPLVHKVTVRCSDGGEFAFLVTRYGNTRDIPEHADAEQVNAMAAELDQVCAGIVLRGGHDQG